MIFVFSTVKLFWRSFVFKTSCDVSILEFIIFRSTNVILSFCPKKSYVNVFAFFCQIELKKWKCHKTQAIDQYWEFSACLRILRNNEKQPQKWSKSRNRHKIFLREFWFLSACSAWEFEDETKSKKNQCLGREL